MVKVGQRYSMVHVRDNGNLKFTSQNMATHSLLTLHSEVHYTLLFTKQGMTQPEERPGDFLWQLDIFY